LKKSSKLILNPQTERRTTLTARLFNSSLLEITALPFWGDFGGFGGRGAFWRQPKAMFTRRFRQRQL
jgi:hypothetical protein